MIASSHPHQYSSSTSLAVITSLFIVSETDLPLAQLPLGALHSFGHVSATISSATDAESDALRPSSCRHSSLKLSRAELIHSVLLVTCHIIAMSAFLKKFRVNTEVIRNERRNLKMEISSQLVWVQGRSSYFSLFYLDLLSIMLL